MLTDEEFESWCAAVGLGPEGRALVTRIRRSEPVRLVRGGVGNTRGRYPSRLMGRTIQFESESCELYGIITFEFGGADHYIGNAREFYDQPHSFKYKFKTASGRKVTVVHTPDFFVIRDSAGEFVEFKPEERLRKLANKYPGRYVLGKDGKWRCPQAEAWAARFGLRYVIVSSAELSATFVRNIHYIQDYLAENTPPVPPGQKKIVLDMVSACEGISLESLISRSEGAGITTDEINTLIAKGDLYFDMYGEALAVPDLAHVYSRKDAAPTKLSNASPAFTPKARFITLKEGARFVCDNRVLEISLVGEKKIFFQSDKGPVNLHHAAFEDSFAGERFSPSKMNRTRRRPRGRGPRRYYTTPPRPRTLRRAGAKRSLDCLRVGEPLPEEVPRRTLARWKAAQLTGERLYENPLVGLLPKFSERGDRKTEKIHPAAKEITVRLLTSEYETYVQKSLLAVYGMIILECQRLSVKYPTYVTVNRYKDGLPQYQQALKRKGRRAAYSKKPFYYRLDKDTPRHGDRPFEICHIDHTELDIELVDPVTGENYGRPWASFMVDAFSRRVARRVPYLRRAELPLMHDGHPRVRAQVQPPAADHRGGRGR